MKVFIFGEGVSGVEMELQDAVEEGLGGMKMRIAKAGHRSLFMNQNN